MKDAEKLRLIKEALDRCFAESLDVSIDEWANGFLAVHVKFRKTVAEILKQE